MIRAQNSRQLSLPDFDWPFQAALVVHPLNSTDMVSLKPTKHPVEGFGHSGVVILNKSAYFCLKLVC